MTVDQFNNKLREFLSQGNPFKSEFQSVELWVELQPGMISFGGQYNLWNGEEMPINLKKIGKLQCNNFSKDIQSLHRLTTNDGQSKWNKATFKANNKKILESKFTWDEEFERINQQAYKDNKELSRQKWYWEEK